MLKMTNKGEEWKSLEFLGLPNYAISTHGNVKNTKFNRPIKQALNRGGYKHVCLRDIYYKGKNLLVHRLVALAFLTPLSVDHNTVDHINRNKEDNHVSNLRFATGSEQALNRNKRKGRKHKEIVQYTREGVLVRQWISVDEIIIAHPSYCRKLIYACCRTDPKEKRRRISAYDFIWKYAIGEEENEEWKLLQLVHLSDIYISSRGRVKRTINDVPTLGTKNHGYYCVQIKDNVTDVFKRKFVHQLVALAFIKSRDGADQVNHINGNGFDNNVENLEWVTNSENGLHAYATGLRDKRKNMKGVLRIDPLSQEILAYHESIKRAGIVYQVQASRIGRFCLETKTKWGSLWCFSNNHLYTEKLVLFQRDNHDAQPPPLQRKNQRDIEVLRVDPHTEESKSYSNVNQAMIDNEVKHRSHIIKACEKTILHNGFYWLYA